MKIATRFGHMHTNFARAQSVLAERSIVWKLLCEGDEFTCHITGKINQQKKSHSIFCFTQFLIECQTSYSRGPAHAFLLKLKEGKRLYNVLNWQQRFEAVLYWCLSTLVSFYRSSPLAFPVSWVSTCSNSLLAEQQCISLPCPVAVSLTSSPLPAGSQFFSSQTRQHEKNTFTPHVRPPRLTADSVAGGLDDAF